jgi:hypothetical protein
MTKNKVNTVVAKAILTQLHSELNEQLRDGCATVEKSIKANPTIKKMVALRAKAAEINQEANKIELQIERNPPKGYLVDVYGNGEVKVRTKMPVINDEYAISEMILMAHNGLTADVIKQKIKQKYFKI